MQTVQILGKIVTNNKRTPVTTTPVGTHYPLDVSILDGSGNQITSFGGGTEYTEDVAAAADPVGGANILVRKDAPATVTNSDGDNIAQRGSNYGSAYVTLVSSAGAFMDPSGDTEKWSALSSETLPMPAANSLTSLANGGLVLSSAFDNSSNRHQRAQLYLHVNGASAFTAGSTVDVWVIESNGTTYEDGDASTTPGRPPDAFFFLRATSNQQELYTTVDLPPTLVKFLVRNSGGQAFDATDANNTFGVRTYTTTHVA